MTPTDVSQMDLLSVSSCSLCVPLRCYKVRSPLFLARKSFCLPAKWFNLRRLNGKESGREFADWVAAAALDNRMGVGSSLAERAKDAEGKPVGTRNRVTGIKKGHGHRHESGSALDSNPVTTSDADAPVATSGPEPDRRLHRLASLTSINGPKPQQQFKV